MSSDAAAQQRARYLADQARIRKSVTFKLSDIPRDNLRNNSGYLRESNNVDGGPR